MFVYTLADIVGLIFALICLVSMGIILLVGYLEKLFKRRK